MLFTCWCQIVERLVLEQIRNFIVLPNKISVPLAKNLPIKGIVLHKVLITTMFTYVLTYLLEYLV
jgi:hypothetical protein